jgi:hypothetical protein
MYPSVMSPLPDVSPYAHPTWPPDANALTRLLAEAILVERGLLLPLPSRAQDSAALRREAQQLRAPPD